MAKIMQINITCGRGSTGDIALRLYRACQENGDEARFAYTAFKPTMDEAFRIENGLQHYLRRGLNKFLGKKQSHSTLGTRRLMRYILKEKPDVLHIHNVQQNCLNYLEFFDFLQKSGIPVVFTLHDCWSFTGGCYYYCKWHCEKYTKAACGSCIFDLDDITMTAGQAYENKQRLIGGNDNIHPVCVSQWLRSAAMQSYMNTMKHPPTAIYNGVDTQVFYPRQTQLRQQLGISPETFLILGVANYWNEDKGLHYFEALSQCLPENCQLVLVGHGLERTRERCGKLLCLPPTNNREALAELYSCADVYVNPTRMETFGMTTAEAMACGTPVVVFNVTACPEVADKHTGVCVDFRNDVPTDVQSLMAAIREIQQKGKAAYTQNCVARVRECFAAEKMLKAYLSIYSALCK